ncbi:MAG: hypothetical protein ABIQ81_01220, partial [Novosphingobium sp.]
PSPWPLVAIGRFRCGEPQRVSWVTLEKRMMAQALLQDRQPRRSTVFCRLKRIAGQPFDSSKPSFRAGG